ncbi:hypothetical protein QE152_g1198 [Popillia japonica]|uniref:Retrotransposon gag domain-containing protein n=1 Tax=Popillia japonica TaxID=7064 RepID=A0AAW1N7S6_POPJA
MAIGRLHHQDVILPGDANHIPAGDYHATTKMSFFPETPTTSQRETITPPAPQILEDDELIAGLLNAFRQGVADGAAKANTSSPGAKTNTSSPDAKANTSPPGAKTNTSSPGAKANTSSPGAKANTSSPRTKASMEEDTICRRRLNASTPAAQLPTEDCATEMPFFLGHHLQKAFERINTSCSTANGRLRHRDAILPEDVNHIPAGDCHATSTTDPGGRRTRRQVAGHLPPVNHIPAGDCHATSATDPGGRRTRRQVAGHLPPRSRSWGCQFQHLISSCQGQHHISRCQAQHHISRCQRQHLISRCQGQHLISRYTSSPDAKANTSSPGTKANTASPPPTVDQLAEALRMLTQVTLPPRPEPPRPFGGTLSEDPVVSTTTRATTSIWRHPQRGPGCLPGPPPRPEPPRPFGGTLSEDPVVYLARLEAHTKGRTRPEPPRPFGGTLSEDPLVYLARLEAHTKGRTIYTPEDVDDLVRPYLTGEATRWYQQHEGSFMNMGEFSQRFKAEFLSSRRRRDLREAMWYQQHEGSFMNMGEFSQRFKAEFLSSRRRRDLREAMEEQQDPAEPPAAFVNKLRRLCLRFDPDWEEAELVSHIVERMTDQYCFAIAQANPRTMADLVALCAKWMDLFERRKPAAKPSGAAVPAGPPKTAASAQSGWTSSREGSLQPNRLEQPYQRDLPRQPDPPNHLEPEGQPPRPTGQTIKRPDAHQNAGSARDTISTEIVRSSLVGGRSPKCWFCPGYHLNRDCPQQPRGFQDRQPSTEDQVGERVRGRSTANTGTALITTAPPTQTATIHLRVGDREVLAQE